MTTIVHEDIRIAFRSPVEAYAKVVKRVVSNAKAVIEEATSTAFPVSTFLTLSSPFSQDEIVIELAARFTRHGRVISAEILLEDGQVLAPALVRTLPDEVTTQEREETIRQFVDLVGPYLKANLGSVVQRLGAPKTAHTHEAALKSDIGKLPESAEPDLRLASWISDRFHQSLSPRRLPVKGGKLVEFDFVSPDKRFVGQIKMSDSGRLNLSAVTEMVWQLQRVEGASVCFLVVGPSRRPLDRWVKRYGRGAAAPVEMWAFDGQAAERVA